MNILFLERYNNYANRIIKHKELYIEDILATQASEGKQTFLLENVNFNPNDGIVTEFIVGDTTTVTYPGWNPDYCIVYDPASIVHNQIDGNDYTPFETCWFIIESQRTRGNQYKLSLKRDVIRDKYDSIKTADIYVEKGTVDPSDSFIFNQENLDLNQIKQSETLLKDKTGCQWIVGYVVQDQNYWPNGGGYYQTTYSVPPTGAVINWSSISSTIKAYISLGSEQQTDFLANYDNSADYEIYCKGVKQIGAPPLGVPYIDNYCSFHFRNTGWEAQGTGVDNSGYEAAVRMGGYAYGMYDINSWPGWDGVKECHSKIFSNRAYLMQQFRNEMSLQQYDNYITLLNNYNGKVIYDGTSGKYYKITVEEISNEPVSKLYSYNTTSNLRSRVRNCFSLGQAADSNFQYNSSTTSSGKYFQFTTNKLTIKVSAKEQGSNSVSVYLSNTRKHIVKEPFDMFCIPYGYFQTKNFVVNQEASLAAARALAQAGLGSAGQTAIVYDIQLLPYCPLQNTIRSSYINESTLTENEDYQYIYGPQNSKLGIMFWCTESEFTFDITHRINISDVKMENLCDIYRLCSPNYNGIFEFSAAKNGGVSFFNVDCSYKPYQPYIHVNPNFGRMYGQDFNDSRGLICGGDFSIAIATNAWEQYKLNNKNYQAIFDRDIQKMDAVTFENLVLKDRQAIPTTIGALTGAAGSGNYAGFFGSLFKGQADLIYQMAEKDYMSNVNEINKSYKKDMFTLQNGNVKALPNSLAKTDPFTFNNKKWPFLEKYSCTEEEKEALRQKLKFDGMNVGRIGKITEYTNPAEQRFFKGELIRDNFIIDDSHMVDAIYSELAKGVYI